MNRSGESQCKSVRLRALRHVHHNLGDDTAPLRLHLRQRFNRDVRCAGIKIIDLDAGLLQGRSTCFGFQRPREFIDQRLHLRVQFPSHFGIFDYGHTIKKSPQSIFALRCRQEGIVTRSVGDDPGGIAEPPGFFGLPFDRQLLNAVAHRFQIGRRLRCQQLPQSRQTGRSFRIAFFDHCNQQIDRLLLLQTGQPVQRIIELANRHVRP